MLIYSLFAVLSLFIANIDVVFAKNKLIVKYILFFLIISVIGLRYETGIDWLFYKDFFNGENITLTIEPGYQLLSLFISYFGFSFWFFVSLIAIFILLILSVFFERYSPYPIFCLSIYFISSFGFNVEALRQVIAVAIYYIALGYYLNGNKYSYLGLCLLASFFHVSAAILVIVPFLDNEIVKRIMKLCVLAGLIMAAIGLYPIELFLNILTLFSHNPYLDKILWYSLPNNVNNAFSFNLLFKIFIISCYFYKRKYIYQEIIDRKLSIHIVSSFETLVLIMLIVDIYLGRYGTITSRMDEYFSPILIILFSYLLMTNKKIFNRLVVSILFSSYILISFFRFTSNDYFQNQYVPYRNYLYSQIISEAPSLIREQSVQSHWINRNK